MEDDDLLELKGIFLDECVENMELLESGLMRMGDGDVTSDTLNEVFRAAHSIKGGAATFGFMPMSELTHEMENLLDATRSGRHELSDSDVDLLLKALDLVKLMQAAARDDGDMDQPERADMQLRLAQALSGEDAADAPVAQTDEPAESGNTDVRWRVVFQPKPEFMRRGNDPLLLLRELARLGNLTLEPDTSELPAWNAFDPASCYLKWQGELVSDESQESILELFAWVENDCVITVEAVTDATAAPAATASPDAVPASDSASNDVTPDSVADAAADATPAPADTAKFDTEKPKPAKPAADKAAAQPSSAGAETSSIRIATSKIDQLIDLIGELVITQSMLSRIGRSQDGIDTNELQERLTDLEHNTRDLQESVMQVRMLPLSSAFSRLPRMVRDLSRKLDKNVNLVLEGGTTELDKTVLERMIDPLVHIVRNSLDHGIESSDVRLAAGKPEKGTLALKARQESDGVVIEITDDGAGINSERVLEKARKAGLVSEEDNLTEDQILQLVFSPSFSTAATVSDVSGRGVGMDVVKQNILALGGRVQLFSTLGQGTRIEINLPLSLAILDGQMVRIGSETYVIPILSIIETLEIAQTNLSVIPGIGEVCRFRGNVLKIIRVDKVFGMKRTESDEGSMIVIVEMHGERSGLVIDEVLGQQQVVIKSLDRNYANVKGLAGATIMSDGLVALILDPATLHEEPTAARAA